MSTPNGSEASRPVNAANPVDMIEPHILAKLDPDFVQFFTDFVAKNPPPQTWSIEEIRAKPEKFRVPIAVDTAGMDRVTDHEVSSEDGAKVPLRVYHPDPAQYGNGPYPVHLNFHGKPPTPLASAALRTGIHVIYQK